MNGNTVAANQGLTGSRLPSFLAGLEALIYGLANSIIITWAALCCLCGAARTDLRSGAAQLGAMVRGGMATTWRGVRAVATGPLTAARGSLREAAAALPLAACVLVEILAVGQAVRSSSVLNLPGSLPDGLQRALADAFPFAFAMVLICGSIKTYWESLYIGERVGEKTTYRLFKEWGELRDSHSGRRIFCAAVALVTLMLEGLTQSAWLKLDMYAQLTSPRHALAVYTLCGGVILIIVRLLECELAARLLNAAPVERQGQALVYAVGAAPTGLAAAPATHRCDCSLVVSLIRAGLEPLAALLGVSDRLPPLPDCIEKRRLKPAGGPQLDSASSDYYLRILGAWFPILIAAALYMVKKGGLP